jgi:hypothetical protein
MNCIADRLTATLMGCGPPVFAQEKPEDVARRGGEALPVQFFERRR